MSLRQAVGDVTTAFAELISTRLELLSLEAAEQKSHLLALLALSVGAGVFALLALVVFTVAVAMAVWPTEHRYLALVLLAAGYAAIGVALFFKVRKSLREAPAPFQATRDELQRDIHMLQQIKADAQDK